MNSGTIYFERYGALNESQAGNQTNQNRSLSVRLAQPGFQYSYLSYLAKLSMAAPPSFVSTRHRYPADILIHQHFLNQQIDVTLDYAALLGQQLVTQGFIRNANPSRLRVSIVRSK